jgi:hypothetical protein
MADIEFQNNSMEVKAALDEAVLKFLYEASGELVSQTQRNTPVQTGQLKGSWDYKIDESKGEATIGSPLENAIWNEFGTGQYALHGDGRKTPWAYQDIKGQWHYTHGKRPRRSLQHAWDGTKGKLQSRLAAILKGELGS